MVSHGLLNTAKENFPQHETRVTFIRAGVLLRLGFLICFRIKVFALRGSCDFQISEISEI